MKHKRRLLWTLTIIVLAALGGAFNLPSSDPTSVNEPASENSNMPRYRTTGLEVGVMVDPATPKVGKNDLIIELSDPGGNPISGVTIEAFAEMPAMGAMSAMRAPADMEETAPGHYEGTMNLSMRGEWPLTIRFQTHQGEPVRMQFDLATDRSQLPIASGAVLVGSAPQASDDATAITIDNRHRQMIGVETDEVKHRDLTKAIRAVGRVAFDERLLSQVTLKFDGFIGDLMADYVGAPVEKDQVLFTVYSPELLSAQQEYLESLKRSSNRTGRDVMLRASRERLVLWDMSPLEITALEHRGETKSYIPFYAPRTGVVIERNIADGSAAPMGMTLLTIADLSRIWIEAEVFESDLELVQTGMTATVTLPYLPGRAYTATVEYVYPYLEKDSRTGRIRLSLDNQNGELKPDMYAEVILQTVLEHRLSVPEEAIIVAGDSRVVFVDLGGGRLKPVHIKAGRRAPGFVEVLEGLSAGDIVVTSGNFLIAAETRLKTGIKQW